MSDSQAGLQEFLDHPQVDPRVKSLLIREYPPELPLHVLFVDHSAAVASFARRLARQHGAEELFVWEAAWLHDIGIKYTHAPGIGCHGEHPYLQHGIIGARLCEQAGLPRHALICERHVGTGLSAEEIVAGKLPLPARDMLCQTAEEEIVCYADNFFSKSVHHPLSWFEVRRRVARHGPTQVARLDAMHDKYGEPGEKS